MHKLIHFTASKNDITKKKRKAKTHTPTEITEKQAVHNTRNVSKLNKLDCKRLN